MIPQEKLHTKPPHPRFSSRRGFTMIEVLVTFAILLLLAALLFSSSRRAQANATAAVDAQELRAISSAIVLFAADHEDILPVTAGGVGAIYTKNNRNLLGQLIPYLGYDEPEIERFYPEFAAASWQSEKVGANSPSLLVMHRVYTGTGQADDLSRPEPNITPFGYPYGDAKRAGMPMSSAISQMSDPSACLQITEIDKLHPNFRKGKPGWLEAVPEGMAHGGYRLGLYWDGHVRKLDEDLRPK